MSKLKIYACSGVGSTGRLEIPFTNEGTSAVDNTQAMNRLLARINMCAADAQLIDTTPSQRATYLQDMDIYAVCFHFARLYRDNSDKLREAGYVINNFILDRRFVVKEETMQEHEALVDRIIDNVQSVLDSDDYARKDNAFTDWWKTAVVDANFCGLNQHTREKVKLTMQKESQLDGVQKVLRRANGGWQNDEDLSTYLNDGGTYFIYTYMSDEQLNKLPSIVRIRRNKQKEIYNYCLHGFVPIYGNEADMRTVIATSIKRKFGVTPEQLAEDIASGRREAISGARGVGVLGIDDIIMIIVACAIALTVVLTAILKGVADIVAQKYTVPANPDAGIAQGSDIDYSYEEKEETKSKTKKLILVGGIAAALLLFGDELGL